MKLCIAEKPSVAGEIAKIVGANSRKDGFYEGNGYWVSWTFGHLCGLKEPHDYNEKDKFWDLYNLPIVPKEFGIKLIANKGVEKQFNTIKKLISECEEIINCGDAGQEGELIQRWVMKHAECKVPVKRLWISSLTEEAIKTGFKKLMDAKDFDSLYNAGECRAISDWLYGINATRLFTMKYGKNKQVFSVGRVQTPTLAMIVQRYHEIANFVPQTYFELKTNYREAIFSYSKGKIDDEKKAKELLEQIKDLPLEIKKVSIKEGKEFAPNLFDLTSLQIEANNKLGLSAENTLGFVQSLYEKKLVTYPRVDTVFLPNDMYPKIKGMLEGLTEYRELVKPILEKKIPKPKKVFNDNKVTDHHAIAPTGVIANNISGLEKDVYDLIALRFIAAFYPECKVSNTTIDAQIGKHAFKATGKQILEPGWRAVLGTEKQREAGDKKETSDEEKVLPHFDEGESGPHEPLVDKKKTSAPKEYTEATLLRAMETAGKAVEDDELKALMKENGIGRPSTRANIIETLFKRNYIEKKGKKILPTDIGIHLISVIHNPTLKSPELTGIWEKKLRQIENNEFSAPQFIKEMEELVHSLVTEVIYDIRPVEAKPIVCPKCKTGKIIKGKTAYGCSEWKGGCSFRIPFDMVSAEADVEKLIAEGKVTANNKEVLLNSLV